MIEKCYIIPVQKTCNSNCTFCISKNRNYNKKREFIEINLKLIEKIETLKRRGVKTFEITGGGEPLLHKQIDVLVNLIKTIIPDSYIKLYTNGNILRTIGPVDEINISTAHFNTIINDKIMRPNISIPLENKINFFKEINPEAKIRLSIVLTKGGIDSTDKIDELIKNTEQIVDSYVIRTLYPECPNYEQLYINLDYERKKVKVEKDNNVDEFSGIILWSDGNLYTNWELEKHRHLNSYLLLKPDSRTYIEEIDSLIQNLNFRIKTRLLVNNFYLNALELYKDKDKEYLKIVRRHLLNTVHLFGDTGLIYILDKEENLPDLLTSTYNLKKEIRDNFAFTQNYNAYINYEGNNYHLNLVHAPDPVIEYYNRDLNSIEKFSETRELTENETKLIKKYRSFNI